MVDIDKRAFGEGPVKPALSKFNQAPTTAKESVGYKAKLGSPVLPSSSSSSAGGEPRARGGMHARLEALAGQLDELEQSAQTLQHDLAFSVKVCNVFSA